MRRLKKRSTPRRRARKKEEDSSLRFFILETLSQRFLRNIFIDFQFFEKNKNLCFFQKLFAPLRHIRKVFDKSSGVHNDRLRQLEVIVTSRNNIFLFLPTDLDKTFHGFYVFLTDEKRRIRRNSLKLALINFCQKPDPT